MNPLVDREHCVFTHQKAQIELTRKMGQLLSSSSTSAHDKAILDLKIQRDRLHQYQKRLDRLVEKETQIAKELVRRGERKKALLTLRKKRYQISLMEKTDGQIFNLEQMVISLFRYHMY